MNNTHFLTHEIGSLAKPNWRVIGVTDKPVTKKHLSSLKYWTRKLNIDSSELEKILLKENRSKKDKDKIKKLASIFALRLEETAGLNAVYDGEQQRVEMYEYPVSNSYGFEFKGNIRSFDNKYYKKAAVISSPKLKKYWHDDEFIWIKKYAKSELKIPITGPYTIAAWSYDEYYTKSTFDLGTSKGIDKRRMARKKFVIDVAKRLIRPNLISLVARGATWIQIDEPAVTTFPEDIPVFVEAFNEAVSGIKNCKFGIHICFSDYSKLFPHILKINNCFEYTLEFANRDKHDLGVSQKMRPGYEILKLFKKYKIKSKIGLGVIDIHTDFIEPPELVRDRILYAVKILGNPVLVNPSTDCGLRTRTWEVAFAKMKNLVSGARLAEKALDSND